VPLAITARAARGSRGLCAALVVFGLAFLDDGGRRQFRFRLDAWLGEMWQTETGEWRIFVMNHPCGAYKLGGTLEVRYRGTLDQCDAFGSEIVTSGDIVFGPWLDAERVTIRCGHRPELAACRANRD
jgi:hypothetical protein